MAKTRRLDIEVAGDIKLDPKDAKRAIKDVEDEVDDLDRKLKTSGTTAGKGLGEGIGEGAGKGVKDGLEDSLPDGVDDGTEKGLKAGLSKASAKVASAFKKLGGLAGGAFSKGLKPLAVTAAVGFAADFAASLGPALKSGATAIGHGVGAGLALLPAIAVAGVATMSALKLAVSGVGDALSAGLTGDAEEFEEALKGLSPAAREFARSVAGMRDQLDGMRSSVQESFFAPFVENVKPLAERYLPMIERTLGQIAAGFGTAADESADFLRVPHVSKQIDSGLQNVSVAVGNVTRGLSNLVRGFVPLFVVGATFLPRLTQGFDSAATGLANFVGRAAASGELRAWIQEGFDGLVRLKDTATQLWRIFENVGSIAQTVFSASGLSGAAGTILDTIESVTDRVDRFFQSSRGAGILEEVFRRVRQAIDGIVDPAMRLGGTLVETIQPLLPKIGEFADAFFRFKQAVLDLGLDLLEPAIRGVGTALGVVLPILTTIIGFIADNQPVLIGLAVAIGTLLAPAVLAYAINAGIAAINTLLWLSPILLIIAAITALTAGIIWAYQNVDWFREAVQAVARFFTERLLPALGAVARFLIDGLAGAIRWAADAWSWISGKAAEVRDKVVYSMIYLRDRLSDAITWARDVWRSAWDSMWSKVQSVKDSIGDAISWLRRKISGLIERLGDIPGAGVISNIASAIPGFATGGVVPGPRGAPRLVLAHGGETILPTHSEQAMRGIQRGATAVGPGFAALSGMIHLAGSPVTGTTAGPGGPLDLTVAAGGGTTTITYVDVDMRDAIVSTEAQAERWVVGAWNRAVNKGARPAMPASFNKRRR